MPKGGYFKVMRTHFCPPGRLLADTAKLLGMSYEEVNIWIFLVAWPLLTMGMAIWIVVLTMKYRKHLRTRTLG